MEREGARVNKRTSVLLEFTAFVIGVPRLGYFQGRRPGNSLPIDVGTRRILLDPTVVGYRKISLRRQY